MRLLVLYSSRAAAGIVVVGGSLPFIIERVKMKVREKTSPDDPMTMTSGHFNVHALAEVVCYWAEDEEFGGSDSMFIRELDVFIEANDDESGQPIGWKDMRQAFKDKDIITDNYNSIFFEPANKEDRAKGYAL